MVGDRPEHEWAGDGRVRDVLAGLIADLPGDAIVDDLSGGQRRRVALAKLLVGDWDIVALDEPTNHLDISGVAWLADHLKRRWPAGQGALLVVTHDRWFLDEVSSLTWEVHDGIVEPFEGGYAAYVLQRMERDRQASTIEAKRQNLMKKELAWLRRGAPARTAKPKFRIDAANELIADVPPLRNTVALSQMATARLGKDVVDLLDVGVSYGDDVVLADIEWRIAPGERTGILGVNGAGKSTLLGLIDGSVQPTSGRVKFGKTVRIATLDQQLGDLSAVIDERVSAVIAAKKTTYVTDGKELTPGQLLERLGFTTAQLSTPVRNLSGGQKRRLQLLLILLDEPNVLILDEPTNDMDTDMLAAIEDLLDGWPGTLIVVSHDRYLLERVTDQQYAILPGPDGARRLRHLPGGVDEYLRLQKSETRSGQDAGRATVASVTAGGAAGAGAAGAGAGGAGSAGGGASAGAGARGRGRPGARPRSPAPSAARPRRSSPPPTARWRSCMVRSRRCTRASPSTTRTTTPASARCTMRCGGSRRSSPSWRSAGSSSRSGSRRASRPPARPCRPAPPRTPLVSAPARLSRVRDQDGLRAS